MRAHLREPAGGRRRSGDLPPAGRPQPPRRDPARRSSSSRARSRRSSSARRPSARRGSARAGALRRARARPQALDAAARATTTSRSSRASRAKAERFRRCPSGAAVSHEDLVLEAADGNRFAAFAATPERARRAPASSCCPDVRGLYRFYEELALRFAERGHAAIAIDYFGRTAGVGKRDDDFPYTDHVAADDAGRGSRPTSRAAVARLREDGAEAIFTVGFCFGGRNSWLAAAGRPRPRRRGRLLRRARRAERPARPDAARRRDRGADPRAPGRRRQEHHARAQRRVRGGALSRRRRARARRVRRRAAQLLRPPLRGARRGLGRRVAARARVHRAPRCLSSRQLSRSADAGPSRRDRG